MVDRRRCTAGDNGVARFRGKLVEAWLRRVLRLLLSPLICGGGGGGSVCEDDVRRLP